MKVSRFLKDRNVGKWFAGTIMPSLLPLMTSAAAAVRSPTATEFGEYIKMSDMVFMGLTVNIASANIKRIGMPSESASNIIDLPVFLMILMSMFLVGVYNNPSIQFLVKAIIIVLIVFSLYLNYNYNKRLWKNP